MSPRLQLSLLGSFRALFRDEPLRGCDPLRVQALLAYLALRPGVPQDRQYLAFTFWPDSNEAQARTNLRQLFHTLRRALPEPDRFVDADRRTLLWRADAPATVDALELDAAWRETDTAAADPPRARARGSAPQAGYTHHRGALLRGRGDARV